MGSAPPPWVAAVLNLLLTYGRERHRKNWWLEYDGWRIEFRRKV